MVTTKDWSQEKLRDVRNERRYAKRQIRVNWEPGRSQCDVTGTREILNIKLRETWNALLRTQSTAQTYLHCYQLHEIVVNCKIGNENVNEFLMGETFSETSHLFSSVSVEVNWSFVIIIWTEKPPPINDASAPRRVWEFRIVGYGVLGIYKRFWGFFPCL